MISGNPVILPPEEADDVTYLHRLEAQVSLLVAERPGMSFLELVRRCEGAYPREVADALARRGYVVTAQHRCGMASTWRPELSPLRAEWYFTGQTIAALLPLIGHDILTVGAPTIAEAAAAAGRNTVLVDNSPWIAERCDLDGIAWYESDFATVWPEGHFDTVVVDPPWYFPDMVAWAEKALRLVRYGGQVLMPLFGQFTRPTAAAERASVTEKFEEHGHTRLIPQLIEYETPLYEQEALRASHLPLACSCSWRVADLLIVTKVSHNMSNEIFWDSSARSFDWLEFVVGGQIISVLRDSLGSHKQPVGEGPLLEPVPGVTDWVLDTVSARDERRKSVDIWTSRNRVARLPHAETVVQLLTEMQAAAAAPDGLKDTLRNSPQGQQLLNWLEIQL